MRKRIIKWVMVALWASVIFMFSHQNGQASGNNNRFIIELLRSLGINLETYLGDLANFLIRKAGHFTEFFILYHFVFDALRVDVGHKKSMFISLIIVALYATTDEIHQIYVPGRGPSIKDVAVDIGGGALCMLVKGVRRKRQ